jgi:hypothetical protein
VSSQVAVVRDAKLVLYIKAAGDIALSDKQLGAIHTYAARSLTHYMMPRYYASHPIGPGGWHRPDRPGEVTQ